MKNFTFFVCYRKCQTYLYMLDKEIVKFHLAQQEIHVLSSFHRKIFSMAHSLHIFRYDHFFYKNCLQNCCSKIFLERSPLAPWYSTYEYFFYLQVLSFYVWKNWFGIWSPKQFFQIMMTIYVSKCKSYIKYFCPAYNIIFKFSAKRDKSSMVFVQKYRYSPKENQTNKRNLCRQKVYSTSNYFGNCL